MNEYVRWMRRQHPGSSLLVDTNVLLILVIGSFDPALVTRFIRTEVYSSTDFQTTRSIVNSFEQVVTVQPVLTEVSNLLGQLGEPAKQDCLNSLGSWVETIPETYLPSRDIASLVEFPRFGLTDTMLIYLASQGILVLTDDFPLSGYIEYLGFPVLNFSHIRGGEWLA